MIGAVGAVMLIVFLFLEHAITNLLWNDVPIDSLSPVFNPAILAICVLGGLGTGLIRRYFDGEIAIMAEDLIEFNRDGRFALKRGIELFLRGLVSLVCGAPLGPEAPLTVAAGAAGTADRRESPPARPGGDPLGALRHQRLLRGVPGDTVRGSPPLHRDHAGEGHHDLEGGAPVDRGGHDGICRLLPALGHVPRRQVRPAALRVP